jgi:hypothetical protein
MDNKANILLILNTVICLGVIYLCIRDYKRKELQQEVSRVHRELESMGQLIITLDSINAQKVEPAVYKIQKNYYEIKGIQKLENQDSLVNSINHLLEK